MLESKNMNWLEKLCKSDRQHWRLNWSWGQSDTKSDFLAALSPLRRAQRTAVVMEQADKGERQ